MGETPMQEGVVNVYFDQSRYEVRCEWGLGAIEHLAPGADVIIIVDVLSFSTCVDVATARGAAILPYRFKDESAAAFAEQHQAALAGGRGSGVEYLLSPESFDAIGAGTKVVLPSPNGAALTIAASATRATVLCACLRNASAVARYASPVRGAVLVVAAGERWPDGSMRAAAEDLVGAGAVIAQLTGARSPEAMVAVAAFEAARADLAGLLLNCSSGRELVERGYEADVRIASRHDISSAVPRFDGVAYRNVAGENV